MNLPCLIYLLESIKVLYYCNLRQMQTVHYCFIDKRIREWVTYFINNYLSVLVISTRQQHDFHLHRLLVNVIIHEYIKHAICRDKITSNSDNIRYNLSEGINTLIPIAKYRYTEYAIKHKIFVGYRYSVILKSICLRTYMNTS